MMRFLLFLSGVLIFLSLYVEVDSASEQPLKINLNTKRITVPKELPGAQIVVVKKKGDLPAELLPENIIVKREDDKKNTSNNIPDDMKDLLSAPADRGTGISNKTDSNINKIKPENNNKAGILLIFCSLSVVILGIIIIYMRQHQASFNK